MAIKNCQHLTPMRKPTSGPQYGNSQKCKTKIPACSKKPAQKSKKNFLKSDIKISHNSTMNKPKQKQSKCPQSKTLIKEKYA